MLKLFKGNIVVQITVVVVVAVLLWWPGFAGSSVMTPGDGGAIFYNLLYKWFGSTPKLASITAFFVLLGEGLLLNVILYNQKLIQGDTLMPTFLYVVLMSMGGDSLTLSPILMVNLMLILSLPYTLSSANLSLSREDVFMGGVMVGLSAMFYVPSIWLWIPLILLFTVYKLYNIHDYIMVLLGFAAPLILPAFWLYCEGELEMEWIRIWDDLRDVALVAEGSTIEWIASGAMLLAIAVSLIKGLSIQGDQTMAIQKSTSTMTLPIIAGLAMMTYSPLIPINTQVSAMSIAFLGTVGLLSVRRKKWIPDTIIVILLILELIINHQ